MPSNSGRCLCGAVRYRFDPAAVLWRGHCHCESCRRACSAPIVSWFSVRLADWRWEGKPPGKHRSSDRAERYFCIDCGSQMGYRSDRLPDEIHGLAASLDSPEDFAPEAHYFHGETLPWIHVADGLPRYVDGGRTLEETATDRN